MLLSLFALLCLLRFALPLSSLGVSSVLEHSAPQNYVDFETPKLIIRTVKYIVGLKMVFSKPS